jgi:hypothetical protein
MLCGQNGIGQNGMDKMVGTKWYGQNGTDKMVWMVRIIAYKNSKNFGQISTTSKI